MSNSVGANIFLSDTLTFDPTEITLAVVVATATRNGADVNEFAAMQ